jgi:hypothetical protein
MTNYFEERNHAEGWNRISSEADWHQLDKVVGGFHDGVLKEAHWSHRQHVNRATECSWRCPLASRVE